MIVLRAPVSGPVTTFIMPNPQIQDTEALTDDVNNQRAMDGTPYTYVKTREDKSLTYAFTNISRVKYLEFMEFLDLYYGDEMLLTDWRNDIWRVRLLTSPINFTSDARFVDCSPSDGSSDRGSFTLEFEGVKL